MPVYRGCMLACFGLIIGVFSIALSLSLGLIGLLLPPLAVGFAYKFIDSLILEILYWEEDRNRG
jgi:hypothetical protein